MTLTKSQTRKLQALTNERAIYAARCFDAKPTFRVKASSLDPRDVMLFVVYGAIESFVATIGPRGGKVA